LSAEAAIARPDVIVLDLGLPDMDGVEVCRRVRTWSRAPIVVLSADGTEDRKVEALEAGADDYITKPFGLREPARSILTWSTTGRHSMAGTWSSPHGSSSSWLTWPGMWARSAPGK
jgi:CheY-like chemotaxis protein